MSIKEDNKERMRRWGRLLSRQLSQIQDKTDAELLELMEKNSVESEIYRHCTIILQLRSLERTLKASNRLVWATWVLALVTILLVLISFFK